MLNPKNGHFHTKQPRLLLKPQMPLAQIAQQREPWALPAPWPVSTHLKLYGFRCAHIGRWHFHLVLSVYDERLSGILLRLDSHSRFNTTETLENHRYIQHLKILRQWLKKRPPFAFHWGKVMLEHDSERGGSEIRIMYK